MYWLFSPENFPHEGYALGRTPEYISASGVQISPVKANEWQPVKQTYSTIQFDDYQDKAGKNIVIVDHEIARFINEKYGNRGVLVVGESDYQNKRELLEEASHKVNIEFRKRAIEEFEMGREEAKANGKTYRPTPYIDECYTALDLPKPWSTEVLMAQRDPGAHAAEQIAAAITNALSAAVPAAIANAMLEIQTRPQRETQSNG